jgi:hypothetical protein
MEVIKPGTILIENGTLLPGSLVLASEPYSTGWTTVTNVRSDFEKDINRAGWTFSSLRQRYTRLFSVLTPKRPVHTAVERLIGSAKSKNCNCLEIGQVTMKSFLGLPFASVTAHPRRIQGGSVFAG